MTESTLEGFELSPQQRRLWSLAAAGRPVAYRASCEVLLEGELDLAGLEAAWRGAWSRHEILRTRFACLPGMTVPLQVIENGRPPALARLDLADLAPADRRERIREVPADGRAAAALLDRGSLVCAWLETLAPGRALLHLAAPALCTDGTGLINLAREIGALYGGAGSAEEPLQYADLADWQNELLESEETRAGREHWTRLELAHHLAARLPLEEPRTEEAGDFAPRRVPLRLPAATVAAMTAAARDLGLPVPVFLLAAWNALLGRLAGGGEVLVGTAFDGRRFAEMDGALGLLARYLPVAAGTCPKRPFRELAVAVDAAVREAYKWQESFSWQLFPEAGGNGDGRRYFPFCFDYEELGDTQEAGGVRFTVSGVRACFDRYRLRLACIARGGELEVELGYDPEALAATTVGRLGRSFARLLAAFAEEPGGPLGGAALLSAEERHQLLVEVNDTAAARAEEPLHLEIARRAAARPEAAAVVCEGEWLTYGELDARACALARRLAGLGVGPEARVAVLAERSPAVPAAILGVWKAGGAYVALDPMLPPERLAFMLEDAGAMAVVARHPSAGVPPRSGLPVLVVGPVEGARGGEALGHPLPLPPPVPANLAYVLYTSGSTGLPKGVAVEHRQLAGYVAAVRERLELADGASAAVVSSFAADLGNTAVFPCLAGGGVLHVLSYERSTDPQALAAYFARHPVDLLKIVPSHLAALLAAEAALRLLPRRCLVLGGEASRPEWVDGLRAFAPGCRIFNHYGPTETTVGALTRRLDRDPGNLAAASAPLGRPLPNATVSVVDRALRPLPAGVPGEILLGGSGVTRGYLGRPALTAAAFLPDPRGAGSGGRLYRSGDLGRFAADGSVEFLGRIDHQVKIRGFRIEPGEVEAALQEHPAIGEAVVVVREDQAGHPRLVAYLVGDRESFPAPAALRAFLAPSLPDFMLPAAFVTLAALPRTGSGKLDRRALPAPDAEAAGGGGEAGVPRTPTEELLAGIWCEVLGLPAVGPRDGFFSLGGNSLQVTQVVSRVRRTFGVELPIRSLFEEPDLAALARRVDAGAGAGLETPPVIPVERRPGMSLSFAQWRLWFLDQLVPDNPFYNIFSAFGLHGRLRVQALERAFTEVVRRHEVLRTTFAGEGGKPVQVIHRPSRVPLPVVDLAGLPADRRQAAARHLGAAEARRPFDLAAGPLLRVALLRSSPAESVVLLNVHHIVSDGWSNGILQQELAALYSAFSVGRRSPLPELPVQYADFAAWQRSWLSGETLETQLSYWRRRLEGAPPTLDLPFDRPRPAVESFRGASLEVRLPPGLGTAVTAASHRWGGTVYMTLLAAYKALLARYTGATDLVVGSSIANRTHAEIEGLVGFFVNTLVMRCDLGGAPGFAELVGRVREVTLGAYAHQHVPFERLVEELRVERSLAKNPLAQVFLAFQNFPNRYEGPLPELEVVPLGGSGVDTGTSKFDLTLFLWEEEGAIVGFLEYNSDLFDATTLRRFVAHFRRLVEGAVAEPERSIWRLPLLTAAEEHQIAAGAGPGPAAASAAPVPVRFAEVAAGCPDAAATAFPGGVWSYGRLLDRSLSLAASLTELGVGSETRVAVALERSPEMLAAMLGVLAAGGAYVPLDPAYPRPRLTFLLQDAGVRLCLTRTSLRSALAAALPGEGVPLWVVDGEAGPGDGAGAAPVAVEPESLAYVIYTSGSTGRPKGVMVSHRGLAGYVGWAAQAYGAASGAPVHSSPGFDLTVTGLFAPLVAGGTTVLAAEGSGVEGLAAVLRERPGTGFVKLTPAHLGLLGEELGPTSLAGLSGNVIVGGEALSAQDLQLWRTTAPATRLINEYGPTETVVGCSAYTVAAADPCAGPVPIGRPIAGARLHLLGRQMAAVPLAVAGELHVGGPGVARGYLGRPAGTAERFVPDPFSRRPGGRLYRTGDLARLRTDGNLEFLGRVDHQVKVRGYRIELGEIEAVLAGLPAVREAAVTVREETPGDRRLAAYLVPEPAHEGTGEAAAEQVEAWRSIFDEAYAEVPPDTDPASNFSGWDSSYTGEPIPPEEMREWVEATVERIAARRPRRILEIGCGNGLLLSRLAPGADAYMATDFSAAALAWVEERLVRQRPELARVELHHRPADDLEWLAPASVDAVVLNSVVQYFPGVDYLVEVLRRAAPRVAPGGILFVGDLRSLPLLRAFAVSVELARAPADLPLADLRRRVERRLREEEELVLDPGFFRALAGHLGRVSRVEVLPKRGRSHNELTRFRYDVVMTFGEKADSGAAPAVRRLDGAAAGLDPGALRRLLAEVRESGRPLILTGVPNARVSRDVRAVELLEAGAAATAEALRGELVRAGGGTDPEALAGVAWDLDLELELSWADPADDGRFDALLLPRGAARPAGWAPAPAMPPEPRRWQTWANRPLRARAARRLVPVVAAAARRELPEHMVPASWMVLDELPLTSHGKVDRRALPHPGDSREDLGGAYTAPRTPAEETLAAIFGEVLGLDRVGAEDSFFDLGGHSLLATQVVSRVRETFGTALPLRAVFEAPTPEALARRIAAAGPAEGPAQPPLDAAPAGVSLPLSFAQQRLWFLDQLEPGNPAYNIRRALRFSGPLDVGALDRALAAVVERQAVLRTTFREVDGEPVQVVGPAGPPPLAVADLGGLPPSVAEAAARRILQRQADLPFDLARGPVFRTRLLRLGPGEHAAVLALHHIAGDGWSLGVLQRDLSSFYQAFVRDEEPALSPLPVTYADFAYHQRRWLAGEALERGLDFWRRRLGGEAPVVELPADRLRPAVPSQGGARLTAPLDPRLVEEVHRLGRRCGATPFMTLAAALLGLLHHLSGQTDLLLGMETANRNRREVEDLIGFFVNILPLRVDLGDDPSFTALLRRVRTATLEADAHGDLPFDRLVEELQPDRAAGAVPLVQVVLVMASFPRRPAELPGIRVEVRELAHETAKFDLLLLCEESEAGLTASWHYSTDLFDAATVEGMRRRFEMLLRGAVSTPEARLSEIDGLTEDERRQRAMEKSRRREAMLDSFLKVEPQAVTVSRESLVKTRTLSGSGNLPLVVEPAASPFDLVDWAGSETEWIEERLRRHGAVLFRGCGVSAVEVFERFAATLCSDLYADYGDLPREEAGGRVYHSTPYPPEKSILYHNESSQLPAWPIKQFFHCVVAAREGGETPIVDCREMLRIMDPELRRPFEEKGLLYVRNFTPGLDVDWREFFRTEDRSRVEELCRERGMRCEWRGDDGLRTSTRCVAVTDHPKTGERVFFNQILAHHVSCLDPETRSSVAALFGEDSLPRNVYYGDGTPIPDHVVSEVCRLYDQLAVSFPWQEGDVLLVDNMLTAHSRNPFVGPRKIVVAMGEMFAPERLA